MVSFPHGHGNTNFDHGSTIDRLWSDYGHVLCHFHAPAHHPLLLWLVVSICIGGRSGILRFVMREWRACGFLGFGIYLRDMLLADFCAADDVILHGFFL